MEQSTFWGNDFQIQIQILYCPSQELYTFGSAVPGHKDTLIL